MKTLWLLWNYKWEASRVFIFSVLGLLCVAVGYQLAEIRASVLKSSVPFEIVDRLQRAQIGDFLVMETGEVLRLRSAVIKDGRIHFDIRATSGGYDDKPLSQVVTGVVGVINPTDLSYGTINQCYYTNKFVTMVRPEKWACG